MRVREVMEIESRCVLVAAFFLCAALPPFAVVHGAEKTDAPVFSAAPADTDNGQRKTTPAPNTKDDDAAAVVVDLKKSIQISDDVPPVPIEIEGTGKRAAPQSVPASVVSVAQRPAAGDAPPAETNSLQVPRPFKELMELPEAQLDVAEAILSLGTEHGFELSEPAAKTLKRLDEMSARAKEQLPSTPDASDYFDALYDIVLNRRPIESTHDERAEDYDLSRAVFQHKGSCLSIGIAALAVASRMGAPVSGAQCPNHFFLRGSGMIKGKSHEVPLNFDVTRPTPDNWSKLDDNFYRRWRHFDSKAEDAGEYLRPLSIRQVISAFLASRAGYLAREKKFEDALNDAERALTLNPRNVNALINAGYSKESLHNLEDAENYYKQALEVDPQCVRALNNLAFVKARDKKSSIFDTRKAEKLIDQAIKIDPDQAYLYATRGEIFAAKGEYREATRSMQTAVNLAPKNTAYRERFMVLRDHLRSEGKQ